MNQYRAIVLSVIFGMILLGMSQSFAEQKDVNIPSGTGTPGCEVENRCFIPNLVEIKTGDQVKWKNNDVTVHTITSGSAFSGSNKKFDSGLINAGSEFSHVFEKTGSFPYYCIVHPWMEGMVIVTVSMDKQIVKHDPNIITQTMVSSDGSVFVTIETTKPRAAHIQIIDVRFMDKNQNLLIQMNYDISVIQGGFEIFGAKNQHADDGTSEHPIKTETDKPIDVKISIRGIYPDGENPRQIKETIVFQKIPEFGVLSIIVLAVSITAVSVITRTKLVTKI